MCEKFLWITVQCYVVCTFWSSTVYSQCLLFYAKVQLAHSTKYFILCFHEVTHFSEWKEIKKHRFVLKGRISNWNKFLFSRRVKDVRCRGSAFAPGRHNTGGWTAHPRAAVINHHSQMEPWHCGALWWWRDRAGEGFLLPHQLSI